jgi:hypothetical protein
LLLLLLLWRLLLLQLLAQLHQQLHIGALLLRLLLWRHLLWHSSRLLLLHCLLHVLPPWVNRSMPSPSPSCSSRHCPTILYHPKPRQYCTSWHTRRQRYRHCTRWQTWHYHNTTWQGTSRSYSTWQHVKRHPILSYTGWALRYTRQHMLLLQVQCWGCKCWRQR